MKLAFPLVFVFSRLRSSVNALCLPLALAAALLPSAPAAQSAAGDAQGTRDHPLISRFQGAVIKDQKRIDYDEAVLIVGPIADGRDVPPGSLQTVEGQVERTGYRIAGNRSSLEVMRNYAQALSAKGFNTVYACNGAECGRDFDGFVANSGRVMPPDFDAAFGDGNRYLLARRQDSQGTVHVLINLMADSANERTLVFQQVVTSVAMATDQVKVLDAAALKQGLEAEGKVAVYGVRFDTAKAEILPDSKATLDEMAKLLRGQPSLTVYIVGHTDNAGTLAANLELSQRRAEAVVKALVAAKIEAGRLVPKGVASLAPVASNADEAGRARNRRVELVLQ